MVRRRAAWASLVMASASSRMISLNAGHGYLPQAWQREKEGGGTIVYSARVQAVVPPAPFFKRPACTSIAPARSHTRPLTRAPSPCPPTPAQTF